MKQQDKRYNDQTKPIKVAIQGIRGSYHHVAALNFFEGQEIELIACDTFRDVIKTIDQNNEVIGLMAIENTIAGSLLQNHDLIRNSSSKIVGEYKLRISHTIAALPGTTL